jgi:uncharacterized membrane protein
MSKTISNVVDVLTLAIIFTIVDAVFLNSLSSFFNKMLIQIQGHGIKLEPISTLGAYLVLVAGVYYFIIKDNKPVLDAMLLGWFVYLVYEFTNKAIMPKWSWWAVLIDGTWGGILFGLTTFIYYKLRPLLY